MRAANKFLFFCFLSFVCLNHTHATIFTAIDDGDWDETTTWDQGSVPGSLDTVIIDGYTVTINNNTGNVAVKQLILTNASNSGNSRLIIMGAVTVIVFDALEATAENIYQDVEINIQDNATLNVNGNVNFTRVNTNNTTSKLLLYLRNTSRLNVGGSFTYDYKNGRFNESNDEIFLEESAILDVTGNTYLYMRGGKNFDFLMQWSAQVILRGDLDAQMSGGDKMTITTQDNSHFQITGNASITNSGGTTHAMLHANGTEGTFSFGGNLSLNSTLADKITYMEATKANCVIDVAGDISMSALSDGDVYIELKESSNMFIGGDFLRPTNYGALLMGATSTLTFNGIQSQVLADEDLAGSGADAFNFTNVVLNNTSGYVLEDTMTITSDLDLSNGKIITTPEKILIIDDQANITGGSESAYIDGPMIKKGQSLGDKFVFPIGDENTYAPLEVSAISSSASQYMAQYFGDPPPFGTSIASDVGTIDENQYWELSKTPGSNDVDITLHWMDAAATSITDLNSLIVVGLSEANVWENFGNGGTTGGTGSGVSGSISSTDGDPPPFGVEKFTIGSSEIVSAVEVEFHEKTQILSIYPNPVDKMLYLKGEYSVTDEGVLEVFCINGKRIYTGKCVLENGRFQIATNKINVHLPGTYLLRFTNESGSHVLKFNKH